VVQLTQTETIVYRSVASARKVCSSAERLCVGAVGGSAVGDVAVLGNGVRGLMERMPGSPCTGFA
jgi:outer membrane lipoprotein SlyB